MKKQISRFSIHQTSKLFAFVYFALTAIFCIPLGIYNLFVQHPFHNTAFTFFVVPFFYMLITYLATAFSLWIYNILAKAVGGIEFTVKDVDHSTDNTK